MRFRFRSMRIAVCAVALVSLALMEGQGSQKGANREPDPLDQADSRLPNGKLQRDEILKAEREQNIKDAAQLAELAEELRQDLEKNDRFVFSIATLKKTDDIEKLAKKIRTRMRHN